MERLCERPGCSDPASVAYGMRAEDLVFWLDVLRDASSTEHGVLCRRHADTMVVPRSWTLDDLRDPDLHLFRPPSDDSGSLPRRRSRRPTNEADHEQLALGVEPSEAPDVATEVVVGGEPSAEPSADEPAVVADAAAPVVRTEPTEAPTSADEPTPWMPIFDTDDDLDGLLSATSPLLSRAFRGDRTN